MRERGVEIEREREGERERERERERDRERDDIMCQWAERGKHSEG